MIRILGCLATLLLCPVSVASAADTVPSSLEPGFSVSLQTSGVGPLTQVAFGPDGRLYAAVQDGRVLAYAYGPNGIAGPPATVAANVGSWLLGIGFDQAGELYASSSEGVEDSGFLARLRDADGDGFYESEQRFVTGLPNSAHFNGQLALRGAELFVGLGSRTDSGGTDDVSPVPAAVLLRIRLDIVDFDSSGNVPEVYATGLRNAFGIALDEQGRVWVGDNGPDVPQEPDELNLVVQGADYGFPSSQAPAGAVAAVAILEDNTSADGLDFYPGGGAWGAEYAGDVFQARFAWKDKVPNQVGMDVVRIQLAEVAPVAPTGSFSIFAKGFQNPLDVEVDPFGQLLVMEYGGRMFRIANGAATLSSDVDEIALGTGGTQHLTLDAGTVNAQQLYFVFGSATGTTPGLASGGSTIPLNFDGYFLFTVLNPNTLMAGSLGLLDAAGRAHAALTLPDDDDLATLAGLTLHHAYLVYDTADLTVRWVSHPVSVLLTP